MNEQLYACWKRILSYTKRNWNIDDYPLRFRHQEMPSQQYALGEAKEWFVQVINWWTLAGIGNTKEEARQDLINNYRNYLKEYTAPRPGVRVPVHYADTSRIDALEEIAVGFFEKILHINYYNCFISDQSSIFDFGKDEVETLRQINTIYKLGLPELGDGNIVRILELIRKNMRSSGNK